MPPGPSPSRRFSFAAPGQPQPQPQVFRPYAPLRLTSRSMNDAVIRASDPPRVRPRAVSAADVFNGLAHDGLSFVAAYGEYSQGVLEGLEESLKSAWSLVTHDMWQLATYRELSTTALALNMLDPFNLPGSLAAAHGFDARWGTHIARRQAEILSAIHKLIQQVPRWTPRQWGRAVGRLVGDMLLAKGAGAALKVAGSVGSVAAQVAKTNVVSWELGAMGTRQAAGTVLKKLPTILTDSEGYLVGPVRFNAPLSLRVQRFGLMSLRKLDYWGPRTFGASRVAARRFNAILPSWNDLMLYTEGTIPKGTSLKFGITGSQGWSYPGGLYQVEVNSRSVLEQSSRIIPKAK